LLTAEYERIGATFDRTSVDKVRTVFWHAYAGIPDAIKIIGEPSRVSKLCKDKQARERLADRLTGRPGVHRTSTWTIRQSERLWTLSHCGVQVAIPRQCSI
jgi:hypothetical protein